MFLPEPRSPKNNRKNNRARSRHRTGSKTARPPGHRDAIDTDHDTESFPSFSVLDEIERVAA